MKDSQISPPIPPTPEEIAKKMLLESGLPAETIVANLLIDVHFLQEKLAAESEIKELKPSLSQAEKQAILQNCVMEAGSIMHKAFHVCGVPNEIKTRIRFADGEFNFSFGKSLIIDPKTLS